MMPWWLLAIFVLGVNVALWGSLGLIRLGESAAAAGSRQGHRAGAPAVRPVRPARA